MKNILYIVDMQVDFMPFPNSALPVPGADATIEPINTELSIVNPEQTVAIFFSEDAHAADFIERMSDGTAFPAHCVMGTEGQKTVVDLSVVPANIPIYLIRKNAFDVFEENALDVIDWRTGEVAFPGGRDSFLESFLKQGVIDVRLEGVCSDICVSKAGTGLLRMGFNLTVPRNCVKGLFREIDQVNTEDWGGRATLI